MPKVKIVCSKCGGESVLRDAYAAWDVDAQEWTLSSVYDDFHCDDCGHDSCDEVPADDAKDSLTDAIEEPAMTTHEYAFDLTLTAAVRVRACSEAEARELIATCIDAADTNFGAWPDGSPILGEVTYNREDACDLFEIDGEPVDEDEPDQSPEQIARAEGWLPDESSPTPGAVYKRDHGETFTASSWAEACGLECIR